MVDPHKSFESLQGSFPGVEIDLSGAGDFLDKIDTKIRRVKELMRSVISGFPYRLPKERVRDLVTYAVGRSNLRSTDMLMSSECPRVRFTGQIPEYSSELGLAFGDYIEAYNPKAHAMSNDVFVPRTEPCIALYPVMNTNGSWVMYNLNTKAYVRRSQWCKCATSDHIINVMNQLAGEAGVRAADIAVEQAEEEMDITESVALNRPTTMVVVEAEVEQTDDPELPELEDQMGDESNDEAEDDESETGDYLGDGGEKALEELYQILEGESDTTEDSEQIEQPPLRRSERTNAGVKKQDEAYYWNLMNLSVNAALDSFGKVTSDACKDELMQLFIDKMALTPVKWESLSGDQRSKVVRLHMFLREKYEDGRFKKMKARLVADGRMQDRTVYHDFSSLTAKTKSVMTCLKLAAVHNWDMLKLDISGAFLCADMTESEEVYMLLDQQLSEMCGEWVPGVKEFVRMDGKLVVKVSKAMYGLIQSAKLWYKELSGYLSSKGFKVCKSNECIMVKRIQSGSYLVVILYVDDILVLSGVRDDRNWMKSILEDRYKKVTSEEGDHLPYLGMTIVKSNLGYEICMKAYIDEIIKMYGRNNLREYTVPVTGNLFKIDEKAEAAADKNKFHSIVAKLLYLGK
jgi:hypothetical protein